jgi:hypothetical protein
VFVCGKCSPGDKTAEIPAVRIRTSGPAVDCYYCSSVLSLIWSFCDWRGLCVVKGYDLNVASCSLKLQNLKFSVTYWKALFPFFSYRPWNNSGWLFHRGDSDSGKIRGGHWKRFFSVFCFSLLIIVPPSLHAHQSPPHRVCHSPDWVVLYYSLGPKLRPSFLTPYLTVLGIKVDFFVSVYIYSSTWRQSYLHQYFDVSLIIHGPKYADYTLT